LKNGLKQPKTGLKIEIRTAKFNANRLILIKDLKTA
jgi:hypothetical protein